MRFRVGVVLLLFLAYFGVACRTPLTPNVDRNQAPETWITAAPFDTVTIVKGILPVDQGVPGKIPVRFHIYWAGSDRDGAVAGFYWAVVETLPLPPPNSFPPIPPPLPGPKPSDYHFTTRSDSFFIFSVAEDIPDRQHAFFIYSVDDKGKPDPTPARFIFLAQDRFPPAPVFTRAMAVGSIFRLVRPGVIEESPPDTFPKGSGPLRLTEPDLVGVAPKDTVPSGSTLFFAWTAELTIPGTVVTRFRYKLDEAQLLLAGPRDTTRTYFSGVGGDTVAPVPGTKVFTVRAVDQASGSRDSTRRFQYGFSPITWWAGPDLSDGSWKINGKGEKYRLLSEVTPNGPGIAGSLMSPDSTQILPAKRLEQRTFLEIWKDTVFARAEFDTVHMNSWAVFHGGGFDPDSRYGVKVNRDINQIIPPGDVLVAGPKNGSAIGIRSLDQTRLDPYSSGVVTRSTQTGLYPLFDPNDVFNLPRIAGYHPMFQSGKVYAVLRAEDADGGRDGRAVDPVGLADRIDQHGGPPDEVALRNQVVMVFYVNRPPVFSTNDPSFFPKPNDVIRTRNWDLYLPATDVDPFLRGDPFGGPRAGVPVTLRRHITVKGKSLATGRDLIYTESPPKYYSQPNIDFTVPDDLASGNVVLEVELCDCDQCEFQPGTGRCTKLAIPIVYERP